MAQLKRLAAATPEPLRGDYTDSASWLRACDARGAVVQAYWDEYGELAAEIAGDDDDRS